MSILRYLPALGLRVCRPRCSLPRNYLCTTTEAATNLHTNDVVKSTDALSPRIATLLDELVSLNMLEVRELTGALKNRLGIDDSMVSPMSFNPSAFAGMVPGAPPADAAQEKPPEKTHFELKLEKFDAAKKIAIIKEIRTITGLGLKEAKALVDEAPKVFKSQVAKEEAEQIRDKLKEIGAEVSLD